MTCVPAVPRIIAGDHSRSLAEIEARARCAAGGLASLGIGPGAAVALLLRNDHAFFEAQRATAFVGAVPVVLDHEMGADDLFYVLADCEARALVAHADLLARLRSAMPPALPVLVVPTPPFVRAAFDLPAAEPLAGLVWDDWLAVQRPREGAGRPAEFSLGYTSGTTGRPKGVRRFGSRSAGSGRASRVYGFEEVRMAGTDRAAALITGPLSHSVPRAFAKLALDAGADVVLMPRFDAEAAAALIARHRITHVHLSPAMMTRMLRMPAARRHDLSSLRHVIHGAAPCSPAIKAEAIAAWGPIVHEYYGSTETGLLTLADSGDAERRPRTVGRALPGITLSLRNADGGEVPTGAAGTIFARSGTLHQFTYTGREAERGAIAQGEFVTAGDVGHLDAAGYLFLHDRCRHLIRSEHGTIVPADVEAAILALPGVADCAVLGLPGADGREFACAFVEPLPGVAMNAVAIARKLPEGAPQPGRIVVADRLPRSDTGKVFKHRLRERFAPASP